MSDIPTPSDTFLHRALPFTLAHEGGYSNNPKDSGGATMYGITQRVYTAYSQQVLHLDQVRSVRHITPQETSDIYFTRYWKAAQCDAFAPIVGIALFDFYVQNPKIAVQKLQSTAFVSNNDGIIGPQTIAAVTKECQDEESTLLFTRDYLQFRKSFYEKIVAQNPSQKVFLHGWLNRVSDLAELLGVSDKQLNL